MSLLNPLLIYLLLISISMFFSLGKKNMKVVSYFFNLAATISVIVISCFATEYSVGDLITIPSSRVRYVILLACLNIFQILMSGHQNISKIRTSIMSNFIFISSIVLLGAKDFIVLYMSCVLISFLCVMIPSVPELRRRLRRDFILELYKNIIFLVAILFYYGGTGSLWIEANVRNEYSFMLSYILLLFVLAFKLRAFPFHVFGESKIYEAEGCISAKVLTGQFSLSLVFILLLSELAKKLNPEVALHLGVVVGVIALIGVFYGQLQACFKEKSKDVINAAEISFGSMVLITILFLDDSVREKLSVFFLLHYLVSITALLIFLNKEKSSNKLEGLFSTNKFISCILLIHILNIGMFPLTAGFSVRYHLLFELLRSDHIMIVVSLCLGIMFNIYYALKMASKMFMKPILEGEEQKQAFLGKMDLLIITVLAFYVVIGGVFPKLFL